MWYFEKLNLECWNFWKIKFKDFESWKIRFKIRSLENYFEN